MDLIFRPRRLRRTEALRRMVRETVLRPEDFIYPMFTVAGKKVKQEIAAMPGVWRLSGGGRVTDGLWQKSEEN